MTGRWFAMAETGRFCQALMSTGGRILMSSWPSWTSTAS